MARSALMLGLAFATALLTPLAAAAQGKLETAEITVGLLPIGAHAPIFAAQELGYFDQQGLKVHLQFGQGGAALLPLVFQGEMQIVNIPVATGLQAREQNLDVVMLGPGTYEAKRQPPGQTATIVKADSKIHALRDLAGKTIAVNVINSVNWLYNKAMLAKAGLDLKTVTYVELPFPNMVDAVVNGQVAAAAVVQPFLYFGTSGGKARVLAYDFLEVQPGVQIAGFATSRKWAEANPKTVAAVENGLARATTYMTANPAEAIKIVAKFTHSKPEIIEGTGLPSWSNTLDVENVDQQMRLMVKDGLLRQPQDVRKLIWPK